MLDFLGVTLPRRTVIQFVTVIFPFLMIKDLSKLAGEDDTDDIEA